MPAKAQWLPQLPEIVEALRRFDVAVVDRAVIERAFGMGRRRAIQILHQFGGFQTGRTFLVDRLQLIARLEAMQAGEAFTQESRRRTRLVEALERTRRHAAAARVKIPVSPGSLDLRLSTLPAGIELAQGTLKVEFEGATELLQKLFELSQAAANDFERFKAAVSGRG